MVYTYVIRSKKDHKWYTGTTADLRKRFKKHNGNKVTSTKNRGPFELIYYEGCIDMKDALNRERYLKTGMGRRYLKNRLKRFLSLTGFTPLEMNESLSKSNGNTSARRITKKKRFLSLTGFTLTELVIAVSLLGIVVIAVAGVDLASRRSLISASRRARVQDEVRYAMEHMVRNIRLGNEISPTSGTNLTNVRVRVDRDANYDPNNTPDNFNDDTWVRYDFDDDPNYRILYVPPQLSEPGSPGTEVIARGITTLAFNIAADPVDPIFLTIELTAAHDPSTYDPDPATVDPNNPGVTLHSGVNLRCRAKD